MTSSPPSRASRQRAVRRGARRELEAAKALGTERVHRGRSRMSAPDLKPTPLPDGRLLGVEVKARKRLPRVVVDALEQARRYFARSTIPVGVISETGGAAIAVIDLRDLCELLGIKIAPTPRPRSRARRGQLDMFVGSPKETH